MNVHFERNVMEESEVIALFQSFTLEDLRKRFVWANAFFERSDQPEYYLSGLVEKMYKLGYRVYAGDLEIMPLGRDTIWEKAYLWTRNEDIKTGRHGDSLMPNLGDALVSQDNPSALIEQAICILRAYRNGFDARSSEVQSTLAGLLGVDPSMFKDDE